MPVREETGAERLGDGAGAEDADLHEERGLSRMRILGKLRFSAAHRSKNADSPDQLSFVVPGIGTIHGF
jgi:hypothetical protein